MTARFMNLGETIRWMTMIVWLLKHPDAEPRQGITDERMQSKLRRSSDIRRRGSLLDYVSSMITMAITQASKMRCVLGVHFNIRLEENRQCILVLMGATADGKKPSRTVIARVLNPGRSCCWT